jgi:hypothetical protein
VCRKRIGSALSGDFALQIARALTAAHAKGIVHPRVPWGNRR